MKPQYDKPYNAVIPTAHITCTIIMINHLFHCVLSKLWNVIRYETLIDLL